MKEQVLDEVVARKFLLGQLPPEEQGQIEELAFVDLDTFTFLECMEDELIDDFIQGDLSNSEKQRFKEHFLSLPRRRSNLRISRVLQQHLDKTAPQREKTKFWLFSWFTLQPAWAQASMTTAVLALLIIAVWLFIRYQEAQRPRPLQAGPDKPVVVPTPEVKFSPTVEPTSSPTHVENTPKSPSPESRRSTVSYATALLPSASIRGEGAQTLKLPADASSVPVELLLSTQKNFKAYEAALENEAETVIYNWSNLKPRRYRFGKKIDIEVPVSLLTPQEFYRITLSGISSKGEKDVVAQYPFEVTKRDAQPPPEQ